jgi:6-phosphogluconolactonase
MEVLIAKDLDELSLKVADWICKYIEKTLKKQERFTIVLSGGNTPEKLYQLLASPAYIDKIEWEKIHFFWGDERYVPFDDIRNNARMAFDVLLNHVPVKKENIHIISTDIKPEDAAIEYEKLLHLYFPDRNHSFDLVLLGMGDNAHTLSLFPGYSVVLEKEKWVVSFWLQEQQMHRITLTAPVINAATRIIFLVSGSGKAVALQQVLSREYHPEFYPSQVIQPYFGELFWWVDEAAAVNL